jgi:hypothetical protein
MVISPVMSCLLQVCHAAPGRSIGSRAKPHAESGLFAFADALILKGGKIGREP